MAKPYFEIYNDCQNKLSRFTVVKNILIKAGLLFTAISLIVFGINLINESQDQALLMASAVSFILTATCFLALVPVNNKIKDLRSQRKYRVRNILVHS
ncbi:hypothetical protein AAE02nite_24070 [Adhaeribacter aerolatus]|uniref:Uncharacterized protein n=1 Tax=Adhaeribacter aerolatus TaxID=670289 RepID=A0A512AYF6_9BACT|nr:hypothetical protein [Adhaeribacter aerolatus]GEO04743.1 hypothetical protein AAE02nite_24070 [Adhaeribacter aerolatus]